MLGMFKRNTTPAHRTVRHFNASYTSPLQEPSLPALPHVLMTPAALSSPFRLEGFPSAVLTALVRTAS